MKYVIGLYLIALLFLVSCSDGNLPEVNVETATSCTVASDCVPASCCHADSCVLASEAPDCSEAFCSGDCKPGTMDCGGSCGCFEGQCQAIIPRN